MILRSPKWLSGVLLVGFTANIFVFVVVNFWIYRARFLFIKRNPEYLEIEFPTISRSISDPGVGVPFANWITISAIFLVVAILPVIWLHLRASYAVREISPWLFRVTIILVVVAGISQIVASVGITTLSQYRFPAFNREHMNGSYMFFVAQALVILISSMVCFILGTRDEYESHILNSTSLHPTMNRIRWKFGILCLLSITVYICLFFIKDWDFTSGKTLIYNSYVYLEPMVITFFLSYLLLYNVDLLLASVRSFRD
jgi:hypothetical protein